MISRHRTIRGRAVTVNGYSPLDGRERTIMLSMTAEPDFENGIHLTADEAIDIATDLLREARETRICAEMLRSVQGNVA